MKSKFKILILTFVLASCNKNINSSNDISSSFIINSSSDISSSFINYPEIDATIVDPGNNNLKKTFNVQGKIETSTNERVLPFNTQMTLTSYSNEAYEKLSPIYDYHIKRLHILFDRYNYYKDENGNIINNLKVINDSYASNKEIIIDEDLFNMLEMSIELSKLTKGYFNPTMGSLIDGWSKYFSPYGLTNEEFSIFDEETICSRTISIVNYEDLEEVIELNKEKSSVKFNKYSKAGIYNVIISLGAIAKGYAIDYMRQKYARHETPLLISGSASSSYLKGTNPNPKREGKWNILINSSYKHDYGESIPLLISSLSPERAVSTSGDYEQLFYYKNGDNLIRRHHILNPYSGHSESYYRSITLYSESRSDILDGLSTALFNINDFEIIKEVIGEVEETYNLNIDYLFQKEVSDKKIELYYNEGFEKTINKYYEEIEVINKVRID